jgi:hypothetical protein
MFEQKNDKYCPVASFELYISKLHPDCDAFLQRPDPRWQYKPYWFVNAPLGCHTINNMVKNICKDAGTSEEYTNHCIRATTTTVLKKAGVAVHDIMAVTGHRNVGSVQSYVQEPDTSERLAMSDILAKFGKSDTAVSIPQSKATSTATATVTSTSDSVSTEIVSHSINLDHNASGVFAGANFAGPVTINIQVNK